MNATFWATVGTIITCFIGVIKFFADKNAEVNKRISAVAKEIEDGIHENDTSKITAGFSRLNRK